MQIIRYESNLKNHWNAFLAEAKNASFLFDRNFMEYHQNRFEDHSLIFMEKKQILAIFPANEKPCKLESHGGLSYGGLVVHEHISLKQVLQCFYELTFYCHKQGFKEIIYKKIPSFYPKFQTVEDEFALFLLNSQIIARHVGAVIDLKKTFFFQKRRQRSIEKAKKLNLTISENFEPTDFWQKLLIPNLEKRFQLKPVHTAEEMLFLQSKFPKNIALHQIFREKELLAGTIIWQNEKVVHAQYIAGNELGKKSGALDLLFDHLLKKRYVDQNFFSFGISTSLPKLLNQGLLDWKTGFGAKIVLHDIYSIESKNFLNLENFI